MNAIALVELIREGYQFLGRRMCESCGEEVSYFLSPNGKRAPFVLRSDGKLVSHFATCLELRDAAPARKGEGRA